MESVKAALRLLELVAERQPVSASELTLRLGEPKTTVRRGLVTLEDAGWIRSIADQRDGRKRRWMLTSKMLTLGRRAECDPWLRELALPFMEGLRQTTAETIHLVVPEGRSIVLVERLDSPQPLRTIRSLGARAPMHVTSTGKSILAFLPEAEREAYLSGPLRKATPRSIIHAGKLRKELDLIRRRWYAVNAGELDEDVRAVAAPVFNGEGRAIAAMSISCPATRLPDERIGRYAKLVKRAAEGVTRALAKR